MKSAKGAGTLRIALLATVTNFAGHSIALAQDTGAGRGAGPEAAGSLVLQEVIVTATRRAESVLEVPLSITALSTDNLVNSGIKNVDDLSTIVPGISFQASAMLNPALTNISIRGVSSASGDPTTGVYLDETSLGEQGNTNFGTPLPALFDIERVEVLRGPQGTLFGAGSMGGAVRFIQNQPGLVEYSGRATAEVGFIERGGTTREAGVAFGGPIVTDTLGFRVTLWERRFGGFIDRFDPVQGKVADRDANRVDTQVGRLALTWAPNDAVKITPAIYWQKLESPNAGFYHMGVSDPGNDEYRNGSVFATPISDRFYVSSLTVQAELGFADLTAVSSYTDRTASSVGDLTASFGARAALFHSLGPCCDYIPANGYGNPYGAGFAGTYDDWETQTNSIRRHSFSQEVRLSSSNPDARLKWTAGAYYDKTGQFVSDRWTGTPFDFFPYLGANTETTQEQLAAFAQIDLRLVEGLTLTAGARYARIEVEKNQIDLLALVPHEERTVDKPVNPKVGLEYQFDSGNMIYASAGKGFRAGGVNVGLPLTVTCTSRPDAHYDSDSLWSYEIGTKNRLFDDRVTLVASAFHIKWSDIQTGVNLSTTCGGSPVSNAGTAEIDGVDMALSVALSPQLRADISGIYNDSKYTESVFTGAGKAVVLDGYALSAATAPWSVTGSLEYSFQVGGKDAFIRAENIYRAHSQGPFVFDVPNSQSFNPDLGPNPGWNVLNLRTGVTVDKVRLALFVTNALDRQPTLGWDNRVPDGPFVYANTITPRTVGLNLNYDF